MGHRVALRLDGRTRKADPGFCGGAPALANVAPVASADDVPPSGGAASRSRHYVIERQLSRRESLGTVLTRVVITCEKRSAVELDSRSRHARERQNTNDPRYEQVEANRSDPIVPVRPGFAEERAQLSPVVEVIGYVAALFERDDFRNRPKAVVALEEQGERTAHSDDAKSGIMRIEQQDVTVKARRCIGSGTCCEDKISLIRAGFLSG